VDAGAPRALIRRNHYSIRFNPLPMAFNDEVPRTAPLRARAEDAAHESSGEALSWGPPEVAVAEAVVVAVAVEGEEEEEEDREEEEEEEAEEADPP